MKNFTLKQKKKNSLTVIIKHPIQNLNLFFWSSTIKAAILPAANIHNDSNFAFRLG